MALSIQSAAASPELSGNGDEWELPGDSIAGRFRDTASQPPAHLFDSWPDVARRLLAARQLALFLDFDGTLTPIRRRPEDVWLSQAMRATLARLGRESWIKVWIISGRERADLERRVGLKGVCYLGLYGWQDAESEGLPKPALQRLLWARRLLRTCLSNLEGVWIEDKGAALAIHYREATENAVRRASTRLTQFLKVVGPGLRIVPGKKVWEVLPLEVRSKGENLLRLLAPEPPGTLGIFVGDDTGDEEAFGVLRDVITVRVGPARPTCAEFRLNSPGEVRGFLQRLQRTRQKAGAGGTTQTDAFPGGDDVD